MKKSNAKIMDLIPSILKMHDKQIKMYALKQCKLLWIKLSPKCRNVIVNTL